MVLELVAGRLIARYLGSSLYTWTSVIGVVLAGITIGNYLGGRIADRFPAGKALSMLFAVSSAACVVVIITNNLIGNFMLLWKLSLPLRVFCHVSLVFLLPSTLLGMISPVVAKMALEKGLPTGRTVGDIYAWGAAGSILGTFVTGFYLIAAMGTTAIIWTVSAVLLFMAILYWHRLWVLYAWAVILLALFVMGMAPFDWADSAGSSLGLREQNNPNILYQDETQYSYIAIERFSKNPDKRIFYQDNVAYSEILMEDVKQLQCDYLQICVAVMHLLNRSDDAFSMLGIGGGGYIFPRYVEQLRPKSRIDVVEIDPGMTEAAIEAFGLPGDTGINIITKDARNYVDELLMTQKQGGQIPLYDFILGDAFYSYMVPYQLVTKEFNDKISQILADDGLYVINLIDNYESGLFLGAMINTLQQTFQNIYVIAEAEFQGYGNNFVVVAANRKFDVENLYMQEPVEDLKLWILNSDEIKSLKQKAAIVLTDNYAPVENLLAPVAMENAMELTAEKYFKQGKELHRQKKWNRSIRKYKTVIDIYPRMSVRAYNDIGSVLAAQGKWQEAADVAKKALEYNEKANVKRNVNEIHYNLAVALKKLGRNQQARGHLREVIRGYRQELAKQPNSAEANLSLGIALAQMGNFTEAVEYFRQAVDLNHQNPQYHLTLAKALVAQKHYDQAIEALKDGIAVLNNTGSKKNIIQLEQYLRFVESTKQK
jgi:tetratricopeptide (TPR) repeat protein